MEIGDLVLLKRINNNIKMTVTDFNGNNVRCRYFTKYYELKDMYIPKDELILESEFKQWYKQQIRKKKIKRLYEE